MSHDFPWMDDALEENRVDGLAQHGLPFPACSKWLGEKYRLVLSVQDGMGRLWADVMFGAAAREGSLYTSGTLLVGHPTLVW